MLRSYAGESELIAAEATQCLAGSALSVGMVVGFTTATVVDRASVANAGR
jgi:predicted Co/Zn/Cd cation transporter (cation efflux family)